MSENQAQIDLVSFPQSKYKTIKLMGTQNNQIAIVSYDIGKFLIFRHWLRLSEIDRKSLWNKIDHDL